MGQNIKVRQPLNKILIPVLTDAMREEISHVSDIIKSEVNVKHIEFLGADDQTLVKQIKPNFKTLGKLLGPKMKLMAQEISKLQSNHIQTLEADGSLMIELDGATFELILDHVEIKTQDMPGWLVASEGDVTVALDININDELRLEGIAREFVNRVQNLRKDSGLEVTDRILLKVETNELIREAIQANKEYVCNEILANEIVFETLDSSALITDIESDGDAKLALVKG